MKEADRLLRVEEVSARTGLAQRTIRQLIAEGRLPVVRPFGLRAVRIPESALASLMVDAVTEGPR